MIFYRRGRNDVVYPAIPVVRELKVLGVFWNDTLSWNNHFCKMLKTASQRLYVIRILKSVLPAKDLILVYHSLISSIFLYASPLFLSLPSPVTKQSINFKNRIICGRDCDCTLFPPLSSLRQSRAIFFFNKCELYSCHPLHHLIPPRLPRSSQYRLPHVSTTRRLHSFIPSMCILLNSLK